MRAARGAPMHRTAPPPEPRSGWRSALWLLVVLLVVAGAVAWIVLRAAKEPAPTGRFQIGAGRCRSAPRTVEKGDMPVMLDRLGTVTPLATVTVKTQINGQLIEVAFKEGQMVKKGDFLAQIDPRPYQVALEQAEGQLAKDQALLKNAELDLAALQHAGRAELDRQADPRHAGLRWSQQNQRDRAGRSGADRRAKAQPHLLPHRLAGQRTGRAAPGRSPAITCRPATPTASSSSPSCSRSR